MFPAGCVLGDDMGLGKTIQIISLIAALLKKTGTGMDQLAIKEHGNKVKKVSHRLKVGVPLRVRIYIYIY